MLCTQRDATLLRAPALPGQSCSLGRFQRGLSRPPPIPWRAARDSAMSILVDRSTRVIVQGITGREAPSTRSGARSTARRSSVA
jgi:hypothetical protein